MKDLAVVNCEGRYENEIERTEDSRRCEKKYRALFQYTPMPMWVLELPLLNILDVNEAAIKHYGYSREEFLGLNMLQVCPGIEKDLFVKYDHSVLPGINDPGILKTLAKDGSGIHVELTSQPIAFENKDARLVFINDITKRKKAEEKLDIALQAGKIGIWELDMASDKMTRNLLHDQIFGYAELQSEWGINNLMSHILPEDLLKTKRSFEEATTTRNWHLETRIVHKDKSVHWIRLNAKVEEEGGNGNTSIIVGTVVDITGIKKAEEEHSEFNAELERQIAMRTRELDSANKEMESFSYSVSHDLRAPLRAILGYAQILTEECKNKLSDEGARLLNRVTLNAKKMSQLIDDLLEFSRLGKSSLGKKVVNLNKIVQEVIGGLSQSGKYHTNITVGELGVALADESTIRMLFQNLLLNATKYSSKIHHPAVEVGAIQTGKGLTYFVKDNGVGFDMTYYEKLFGVFQRLHRQEEFEGTGVGLAIVQKIVLKHGGQVWAESKVNEGATFFFTLNDNDVFNVQ